MAFQLGGKTFVVNASGADITGFDPSRDRLDFGDISVHGLILGRIVIIKGFLITTAMELAGTS